MSLSSVPAAPSRRSERVFIAAGVLVAASMLAMGMVSAYASANAAPALPVEVAVPLHAAEAAEVSAAKHAELARIYAAKAVADNPSRPPRLSWERKAMAQQTLAQRYAGEAAELFSEAEAARQ